MKVLIYINKNLLKDSGGPIGYCNTLYKQVKENNDLEIEFLDFKINKQNKLMHVLRKISILRNIKRAFYYSNLLKNNGRHFSPVSFKNYDIIHFHLTEDMFACRDSLKDFKGKVVLTSHSPTYASNEYYLELSRINKILFGKLYKKLIIMDRYAFKRSDDIIFPCKEAMEPYISDRQEFTSLIKDKKIFYLPTGIYSRIANISVREIREKYKIPDDAFVVSYVGRHNTIKGYDILKRIGLRCLEKRKNLYFIIAGKEKPLKGLSNQRRIEIGRTNDSASIIKSSDVFILPNRNTYFDIVLLEVLSLSLPIIFANNGGNKYMYKYNTGGMFSYDTEDEAINFILYLSSLTSEKLKQLGSMNRSIYESEFNEKDFYNKYKEILCQCL